jgi:hypothetical protein
VYPVCRFYGNPALNAQGKRIGPNSHFYTANPTECDTVAKDSGWILETRTAFFVTLPDSGEACKGGSSILRWYNNGFPTKDSNHRLATTANSEGANYAPPLTTKIDADMRARDWRFEGSLMCAVE